MLKTNTVQTNFTSGELSPRLLGRSDIERYQNGAEIIENMHIRHQGGLEGRLGTQNVARTLEQAQDRIVRIYEFVYSRRDAILIEISEGRFRFYKNGAPIYAYGVPYEIASIHGTSTPIPYLNSQINELQFAQSADVLFITHEGHPPATLSRHADTDWRFEQPEYAYGPYMDQQVGDQNISLTVDNVTDRVVLTSTEADFSGVVADQYVEYAYLGQKVLGRVKAVFSDYRIEVEPLEDRSLIFSKEVYSPGTYTGWDATNSQPVYGGPIEGTDITVAFSATGVVTQEHIGNFIRFADRNGTYYWMEVKGVSDILRQGAYGILAFGDILTVVAPAGVVTRSERVINARLRSSSSTFFNLSTDHNRLFRLVLGEYVVHARGRQAIQRDAEISTGERNIGMSDTSGINVGDSISGSYIPTGAVVEYIVPNEYIHISADPTDGGLSPLFTVVTVTINANTTQSFGVTLNRSIPRSVEGLTVVQDGTTNDWNKGAWYIGNFPRTVSFHEGRLGFAGTPAQPQTGWLSRVDDLYNFGTTDEKLRVLDDCAINFTIASDTVNEILWMVSRGDLLIGTVGEEWKLASTTQGAALTPTTVSIKSQSTYGSEMIKPIRIGKAVLYLQRAGRKLRQMAYDYATDSQVSLDLTVFAEHVLKDHGGAQQICYQQLPESVLYVRLGDGQIGVFTYESDQQIYAWSRFKIGGPDAFVESIACIPENQEYRLYMVVSRTIAGANVRTIERLKPEFRPAASWDKNEMIFMDNYASGGARPSLLVTGLNDLKGCTVSVFVDGRVWNDQVVSESGTYTLPVDPNTRWAIGFPFESRLKTFPLEVPAQKGTTQGKLKRIDHVSLRLLNTIGFEHGPNFASMREQVSNDTNMMSGDIRLPFDAAADTRGCICIRQRRSRPLSILSLMPESTQYE